MFCSKGYFCSHYTAAFFCAFLFPMYFSKIKISKFSDQILRNTDSTNKESFLHIFQNGGWGVGGPHGCYVFYIRKYAIPKTMLRFTRKILGVIIIMTCITLVSDIRLESTFVAFGGCTFFNQGLELLRLFGSSTRLSRIEPEKEKLPFVSAVNREL
ncbi:hypothetical protein PHYBLDRAFT_171363 [Phycomyces blakesleeanus NRRL 1555(-)]|uniref:Uncharacterized protein n=1 Tax=Phycomyces blakesleeanus (strain ATCC 8743b / DSM 1359 / FGSC 10004 / NBRC 33097 / NRRL 1555) TaxID=763407 RepID=A0A167LJY6_PHYB8|nr:hypothetical protein PHYBLDRAFT_171363 [Phycomyces blakesleeanus NRRL 1555(-)]OAD70618.1 hypothetical protein PHYBLDRAFT_171363 [Phycomyces blakesleeanus NRRL 1555(-)]|eukprot:XP_018288658.1 hypothetical protein PHYBLDRAFT_171363 [Phycomyces blakesleeanus NRRL 1555(-)]